MVILFLLTTFEFYPQYIPFDSTPYVVKFKIENLVPDTLYFIKLRIKSGDLKRKYFGYTYNPSENRWCKQRTPWKYHPVFKTDQNGILSGWVYGMLGKDTINIDSLKIVIRMMETSENTETDFVPVYTDYLGYLIGFVYKNSTFTEVHQSNFIFAYSNNKLVGTSGVENNRVGEIYEVGYFKIGLPESKIDSIQVKDSLGNKLQCFTVNSAPWFINKGEETTTGSSGTKENTNPFSIAYNKVVIYDIIGRNTNNKNSGIYFYHTKRGWRKIIRIK